MKYWKRVQAGLGLPHLQNILVFEADVVWRKEVSK